MAYNWTIDGERFVFADLRAFLGKAGPARPGDSLAGLAAGSEMERVAARYCFADLAILEVVCKPLLDVEADEVSDLIESQFDPVAGTQIASLIAAARQAGFTGVTLKPVFADPNFPFF